MNGVLMTEVGPAIWRKELQVVTPQDAPNAANDNQTVVPAVSVTEQATVFTPRLSVAKGPDINSADPGSPLEPLAA